MKQLTKSNRGQGRVEFQANLDFIKSELDSKNTASGIYEILFVEGKLTITLSQFRRYIQKLKIQIAAESSQSVSSVIFQSIPPSTDIASQSGHSSSLKSKVFDPKALDNHQLDDEFGITSSDDSDETSQGSEVSNG